MILPSYHLAVYQEESKRRIDYSQIPYFVMASALLVMFALMFVGIIQPGIVIVGCMVAASRSFQS